MYTGRCQESFLDGGKERFIWNWRLRDWGSAMQKREKEDDMWSAEQKDREKVLPLDACPALNEVFLIDSSLLEISLNQGTLYSWNNDISVSWGKRPQGTSVPITTWQVIGKSILHILEKVFLFGKTKSTSTMFCQWYVLDIWLQILFTELFLGTLINFLHGLNVCSSSTASYASIPWKGQILNLHEEFRPTFSWKPVSNFDEGLWELECG